MHPMVTSAQRRLPPLICAALLWSSPAAAQPEFASFFGTVKDEKGQPLTGVKFQLKDPTRGRDLTFETNNRGVFSRRTITPGQYDLVVQKDSYRPIHDKLTFKAGEEKRLEFTLVAAMSPAEIAFARGIEAFTARDYARAAAMFEETIKLAPTSAEAHTNLGLVYLRQGRNDDGIRSLEQAAGLSNRPEARFQLAAAYIEAREVDKAIAQITQGLAALTDLQNPLALDATVTLGSLYFSKGDVDLAVATYEKVLAVRPDSPGVRLGLGKCHFNKGDLQKALDSFKRVVSTSPGSPEAAEAQVFIKEIEKLRAGERAARAASTPSD